MFDQVENKTGLSTEATTGGYDGLRAEIDAGRADLVRQQRINLERERSGQGSSMPKEFGNLVIVGSGDYSNIAPPRPSLPRENPVPVRTGDHDAAAQRGAEVDRRAQEAIQRNGERHPRRAH